MAMSSLRSKVRMATRAAGTFSSSPGTIYGSRNAALFNAHGRSLLDGVLSGFRGSRCTHSRAQQGSLCSAPPPARNDRGCFLCICRRRSLVLDGKIRGEDPAMKTDAYLRRVQLGKDLRRARASYDKQQQAMVEEEEDDDDPAMRARFADWMEKYGRTYRDEEEKNRRFRIFKACARFVDEANVEAAESGSSVRYCLNHFADWSTQELAALCGER